MFTTDTFIHILENSGADETAVLAVTKRLKGKSYRDKGHEDTVLGSTQKPVDHPVLTASQRRWIPEVVITTTAATAFPSEPVKKRASRKLKKRPRKTIIISDDDNDDDDFIVVSSDESESEHLSADDEDEESKSSRAKTVQRLKPRATGSGAGTHKATKRKSDALSGLEASEQGSGKSDSPPTKKQKPAKAKTPVKQKTEPKGRKEKQKDLKHKIDPWKLKSNPVRHDYRQMRCPPLELFHFSRLVVDEFTYVEGKIYPLVTSLKSDHRWILSGTPPTREFATVKTIADFMGVHLGIDDDFWEGQTKESLREAKKRQKEQTSTCGIYAVGVPYLWFCRCGEFPLVPGST